MAVMSSADIGPTEDTLSESPSENGARDDITEDVANRARHHLASLPCAPRQVRQRHDEAEQEEEEPPTPCPRESNQSDAKRVTTAASSDRHTTSPFVNVHTFPMTFAPNGGAALSNAGDRKPMPPTIVNSTATGSQASTRRPRLTAFGAGARIPARAVRGPAVRR